MTIQRTATITAGTTSNAIDLRDAKIVTLYIGSDLTGGSVTMTFLGAPTEDGTYLALTDDAGVAISITIAASTAVVITNAVKALAVAGLAWAKLVTNATETVTIQVVGKR